MSAANTDDRVYLSMAQIGRIVNKKADAARALVKDLEANHGLTGFGRNQGRRWRKDKLLAALTLAETPV